MITKTSRIVLLPIAAICFGWTAVAQGNAETKTLSDGTTCTVVNGNADGDRLSTSTHSEDGGLSSSTTVNGNTSSVHIGGGASGTASAGTSTGSSGGTTSSSSAATSSGPNGTVTVTRDGDGNCVITHSKP